MSIRPAIGVLGLCFASCMATNEGRPGSTDGTSPSSPPFRSVHADAAHTHRGHATFGPGSVVHHPPVAAPRDGTAATVMGYLPYWVDEVDLQWDRLDVVAWFSVGVNADGSLGDDHGWGGASYDAVLSEARAHGVKLILCATRFGADELHELLPVAGARQAAIDNLVAKVIDAGGDGLDIDFEGLAVSDRAAFVSFVTDLRVALDAAQPGLFLSLAMPAIDWEGAYDYDVLAEASDALFIMGYAFSGSWGDPGPNAPLDGSDRWGSYSLSWTVEDYLEYGGVQNASKFLMGLPLYGGLWDTTGSAVPGDAVSGTYDSIVWTEGLDFGVAHGKEWDTASATPYSVWQEGGQWRQAWYEDADSIALKADMARARGIGGFGFWALGYDGGDEELWDVVEQVASGWEPPAGDDDTAPGDDDTPDDAGPGQPTAVVDAPAHALLGETVWLDARGSTDPDGDPLFHGWSIAEGSATQQLQAADQSQAYFVASEPGLVRLVLTVSDGVHDDTAEHEIRIFPGEDPGLYLPAGDDLGVGCGANHGAGASGLGWLLIALTAVRRRR